MPRDHPPVEIVKNAYGEWIVTGGLFEDRRDIQRLLTAGTIELRRHNDDGPGGICTHCSSLHTAVIVGQCEKCGEAVERLEDVLCPLCVERVLHIETR